MKLDDHLTMKEKKESATFFSAIREAALLFEHVTPSNLANILACVDRFEKSEGKATFDDTFPDVTAFMYAIADVITTINPDIRNHVKEDPYGQVKSTILDAESAEICDWYKIVFDARLALINK